VVVQIGGQVVDEAEERVSLDAHDHILPRSPRARLIGFAKSRLRNIGRA
jgi:hypothetical protein